jgi:hypothetical protein
MLGTIATLGMIGAAALTALGTTGANLPRTGNTAAVLAQARQALISRAASDANHPGSLPCPDAITHIPGSNVPNDGIADLLAGPGCPSQIGRLPWRTLGLPDLRDADGERLWYLLAPAYQDSPARVINPGTSGQITAYACGDEPPTPGAWPCAQPRAVSAVPWVAVVFAPGKAMHGQQRDAAHTGDHARYLESYNAADPLRLRVTGASNNDQIATIAPDDLFALVQRRVANELYAALSAYLAATAAQGAARLPWPAAACATSTQCAAAAYAPPLPATVGGFLPSDDADLNQFMAAQGMSWFDQNHWRTTVSYSLDAACGDPAAGARCGAGFAALPASPLPPGTTVVGGSANAIPPGTRMLIAFAGVSGGTAKTQIAFAFQ